MIPLKLIRNTTLFLSFISICSCSLSTDKGINLSFIPCENDDEMGFLDKEGKFVEKSSIECNLSGVINGYYLADDKLYEVDNDIQDTSKILLRDLSQAGIMNDGLIPVSKEFKKIDVMKEDGTLAFTLSKYCGEDVRFCFSYSDSKMRVMLDDGSYIYIDKKGKWLFDKKYARATDFKNGYAIAQLEGQNHHLFSLIDKTSAPIFTFESDDEADITISHNLELLCGKENEKMVIYDFKGKRVLECPSKVYRIQNFLEDGFIFCNDDDEFGLMSYTGEVIIKAKYDQLVANGLKFLASLDDEVDLIDNRDQVIKRFDAEKIIDFHSNGFAFPNIIVDDDDNLTFVDESGDIIADDLELNFDIDDILNSNVVKNEYLPKEHIIDTLICIIDNGKGISNKYGGYFLNEGHCHTYDIAFLNQASVSSLTDKYSAYKTVEGGLNYRMFYEVVFDEPIVRYGESSLNRAAWLKRAEITVEFTDFISCVCLRNSLIKKMEELGCLLSYNKDGKYVFAGVNKNYLYSIVKSESSWTNLAQGFKVIILPNNSSSLSFIQSYKSK